MKTWIGWPPTWATLLLVPALFVGFTVHELAHAVVAYALGDTSQVERRRLTFNPLRHVSWLGLVTFMLLGFGWAKPVWVDYNRFRLKNRPLGMFLVAMAGATSNLIFALLALAGMMVTVLTVDILGEASMLDALVFLLVRDPGLTPQGLAIAFSSYVFNVNLVLAFFNLLPLPPLDGFTAAVSLYNALRNALGNRRQPSPAVASTSAAPGASALAEATPAEIHFSIGLEYHRQGQLDEAVVRYRQAIDQDAQFALAYYDLGLAYMAKGRLTLAAGAFRSAMQYGSDPGLQGEAELRLRELARVEQKPGEPFGPLPSPLDLHERIDSAASGPPPLDPAVARHVWVRLAVGGAFFAVVSVVVWVMVTVVTLMELG